MIGRSMQRSCDSTFALELTGLGLALGLACAIGPGASADAASAKAFGDARRSYTAPDLAVGPDGEVCLVWLAFGAAGDEVLAAVRRAGSWGEPIALSAAPGRYLSPRVAAERDGGCFVVWTALAARAGGWFGCGTGRVLRPVRALSRRRRTRSRRAPHQRSRLRRGTGPRRG